jgi:hypothetical protein
MRTDCTIDATPIRCPNACTTGYYRTVAIPGDLIVYNEGNGRQCSARVLGRVSSNDGKVKGFALVMALSDDCAHLYERWVDPADIDIVRTVPTALLQFFSMSQLPDAATIRASMRAGELSDHYIDIGNLQTPMRALYEVMEAIQALSQNSAEARKIVDSFYENREQYS